MKSQFHGRLPIRRHRCAIRIRLKLVCLLADEPGNLDVAQAEEPLVRRLVTPDSLHVVEDVRLDVDLQALDLGAAVEVLGKLLRIRLGNLSQGGRLAIEPGLKIFERLGIPLGRVLGRLNPLPRGVS